MAVPPKVVNPPTLAPPGGHYSHAVVHNGVVYISGQLPISSVGTKLVDADFVTQAKQCLANITAALAAAGSGVDRLLQVRIYVTDIANWPAFDELYAEWISEHRPARAVVPVPALHFGLLLEIEATAAI